MVNKNKKSDKKKKNKASSSSKNKVAKEKRKYKPRKKKNEDGSSKSATKGVEKMANKDLHVPKKRGRKRKNPIEEIKTKKPRLSNNIDIIDFDRVRIKDENVEVDPVIYDKTQIESLRAYDASAKVIDRRASSHHITANANIYSADQSCIPLVAQAGLSTAVGSTQIRTEKSKSRRSFESIFTDPIVVLGDVVSEDRMNNYPTMIPPQPLPFHNAPMVQARGIDNNPLLASTALSLAKSLDKQLKASPHHVMDTSDLVTAGNSITKCTKRASSSSASKSQVYKPRFQVSFTSDDDSDTPIVYGHAKTPVSSSVAAVSNEASKSAGKKKSDVKSKGNSKLSTDYDNIFERSLNFMNDYNNVLNPHKLKVLKKTKSKIAKKANNNTNTSNDISTSNTSQINEEIPSTAIQENESPKKTTPDKVSKISPKRSAKKSNINYKEKSPQDIRKETKKNRTSDRLDNNVKLRLKKTKENNKLPKISKKLTKKQKTAKKQKTNVYKSKSTRTSYDRSSKNKSQENDPAEKESDKKLPDELNKTIEDEVFPDHSEDNDFNDFQNAFDDNYSDNEPCLDNYESDHQDLNDDNSISFQNNQIKIDLGTQTENILDMIDYGCQIEFDTSTIGCQTNKETLNTIGCQTKNKKMKTQMSQTNPVTIESGHKVDEKNVPLMRNRYIVIEEEMLNALANKKCGVRDCRKILGALDENAIKHRMRIFYINKQGSFHTMKYESYTNLFNSDIDKYRDYSDRVTQKKSKYMKTRRPGTLCKFCNKCIISKLKRHLLNIHKNEKEIIEIKKMTSEKSIRQAIHNIRLEGMRLKNLNDSAPEDSDAGSCEEIPVHHKELLNNMSKINESFHSKGDNLKENLDNFDTLFNSASDDDDLDDNYQDLDNNSEANNDKVSKDQPTSIVENQDISQGQDNVDEDERNTGEDHINNAKDDENMDEGQENMAEGQKNMAEGHVKIAEGQVNMDESQVDMDENQVNMGEGHENLAEVQVNIAEGQVNMDEGHKNIDEGQVNKNSDTIVEDADNSCFQIKIERHLSDIDAEDEEDIEDGEYEEEDEEDEDEEEEEEEEEGEEEEEIEADDSERQLLNKKSENDPLQNLLPIHGGQVNNYRNINENIRIGRYCKFCLKVFRHKKLKMHFIKKHKKEKQVIEMISAPDKGSKAKCFKNIMKEGMRIFNKCLLQNTDKIETISPDQMMTFNKFNKQILNLCEECNHLVPREHMHKHVCFEVNDPNAFYLETSSHRSRSNQALERLNKQAGTPNMHKLPDSNLEKYDKIMTDCQQKEASMAHQINLSKQATKFALSKIDQIMNNIETICKGNSKQRTLATREENLNEDTTTGNDVVIETTPNKDSTSGSSAEAGALLGTDVVNKSFELAEVDIRDVIPDDLNLIPSNLAVNKLIDEIFKEISPEQQTNAESNEGILKQPIVLEAGEISGSDLQSKMITDVELSQTTQVESEEKEGEKHQVSKEILENSSQPAVNHELSISTDIQGNVNMTTSTIDVDMQRKLISYSDPLNPSCEIVENIVPIEGGDKEIDQDIVIKQSKEFINKNFFLTPRCNKCGRDYVFTPKQYIRAMGLDRYDSSDSDDSETGAKDIYPTKTKFTSKKSKFSVPRVSINIGTPTALATSTPVGRNSSLHRSSRNSTPTSSVGGGAGKSCYAELSENDDDTPAREWTASRNRQVDDSDSDESNCPASQFMNNSVQLDSSKIKFRWNEAEYSTLVKQFPNYWKSINEDQTLLLPGKKEIESQLEKYAPPCLHLFDNATKLIKIKNKLFNEGNKLIRKLKNQS